MRLRNLWAACGLASIVVIGTAVPAVAYTNGSRYATIPCTSSCGQQDYNNWCGVASSHAVLHKLGKNISQGTLDTSLVHAREVFAPAIAKHASAVVLVHNHPSGDPTPSEADIKVTRDLIRAGQLLNIQVIDHVILGRRTEERPRDFVSLREAGYFYS